MMSYVLVVKGTKSDKKVLTRFKIDSEEEPYIRRLLLALKESCESWDHIEGMCIEMGSIEKEVL